MYAGFSEIEPEALKRGRVARASVFFLSIRELWVPRPCVLGKGGYGAACTMGFVMPGGLIKTLRAGISNSRPSQRAREGRGTHRVGDVGQVSGRGHPEDLRR